MTFQISHEKFEGPLELLLELIEKEKLSISEISLARVTDDFITFIKALEKIDPEVLAEFLVVAAQLMLIKSKSLLPNLKLSEEDEASIEDLERRLAEYKRFRELAGDVRKLDVAHRRILTREAYQGMKAVFYPPLNLTRDTLCDAFAAVLAAIPKIEKLAEEKIKKIVSLEDTIKHIRLFLQENIQKAFSDITKGAHEKVDIIVSFLAILELARQRFVELEQIQPFEDITIKKI
jgi:segregation and condensation protein A